ncbi:MAG: 3'-5' exonuclease [Chromatiales bacterium]|jgi:predicted PolB exonuclease-like 3'-5' exonuclease
MTGNLLAFALETVPDVEAGRRLYGLEGLGEEEIFRVMAHKRRERTGGSDVPPPHQRRILDISVVARGSRGLEVTSLGGGEGSEADILRAFFDRAGRGEPTLVSWDGLGGALPVLRYRALAHGVRAPHAWSGEHVDLLDVLVGGRREARAPLEEIALMIGLPRRAARDPERTWAQFIQGDRGALRAQCEIRAIEVYLVYLRLELTRGRLSADGYTARCAELSRWLREARQAHLAGFADAWRDA